GPAGAIAEREARRGVRDRHCLGARIGGEGIGRAEDAGRDEIPQRGRRTIIGAVVPNCAHHDQWMPMPDRSPELMPEIDPGSDAVAAQLVAVTRVAAVRILIALVAVRAVRIVITLVTTTRVRIVSLITAVTIPVRIVGSRAGRIRGV